VKIAKNRGRSSKTRRSFFHSWKQALSIVSLRVMDPQGEERDMMPVRDDEGRYHADVLADIPGRWWWRWEADGGVEEGFFDVSPIPEEAERNIERKQAHDKLRDELLKAAKGLGKR
jgi:hypothetical protein